MPRACRRSVAGPASATAKGSRRRRREEGETGGQGEEGAGGDRGGDDWLGRGGPGGDSHEKVRK